MHELFFLRPSGLRGRVFVWGWLDSKRINGRLELPRLQVG